MSTALRQRLAVLMLATIVVGLVLLFRLLPFWIPMVDDWAELSIRQEVATQIATRQGRAVQEIDSATLTVQVDGWIASHAAEFVALRTARARAYREAVTVTGEDGRQHVYLGGEDGYFWLRQARSILERGSPCDAGPPGGPCLDALADAPLGQALTAARSPHIWAIAGLHRALGWIVPGLPLMTTAMVLPLLLAGVLALAVFALARRFTSPFGAALAALAVSCNRDVIGRTIDGDDDIWIALLPVIITSFAVIAVERGSFGRRLAAGMGCGLGLGLLAAIWNGWPLFFLAILFGFAAVALVGLLKRRRRGYGDDDPALWRRALFAVGGTALGLAMTIGVFDPPIALGAIGRELGRQLGIVIPGAAHRDTAPWPDLFAQVAELAPVDLATFLSTLGPVALGLALLGFSSLLQGRSWRPAVIAAMAIGGLSAGALFGGGRTVCLAALVLIVLWTAFDGLMGRAAARLPARLFGLAWLGATWFISFTGERFVFLAVIPLALSAAIAADRLIQALVEGTRARGRVARGLADAFCVGLAVVLLVPILSQGYAAARNHAPRINEAWVASFAALRQESAPDAILNLWWDEGHWAKYFAERGVTSDGTTLRSRSNHWFALALAAPTDDEAVNLLRMLDCGTVENPADGARQRPFEMLVQWGGDEALAYRTIRELARIAPTQAADYLGGVGLSPARAAALRRALYCAPPEGYVMVTTALLRDRGFLVAGLWDPDRAAALDLARSLPPDAATTAIAQRFGIAETAARALRDAAAQVRTEADRAAFAAPAAQGWSKGWRPCFPEGALLRCPLDAGETGGALRLEMLRFDPADPARSRLRGHMRDRLEPIEAAPAVIEIARPDGLEEIVPAGRPALDLGVLVDPTGRRAFVGTPALLRSTLVRLALLDGRYSKLFEKTQDRLGFDGERVTTWRVAFPGLPASPSDAPGALGR